MVKVVEDLKVNGETPLSSRDYAKVFETDHDELMEHIEKLAEDVKEVSDVEWFFPSVFIDEFGEERREYLMTNGGAELLLISPPENKAEKWKEIYSRMLKNFEENGGELNE